MNRREFLATTGVVAGSKGLPVTREWHGETARKADAESEPDADHMAATELSEALLAMEPGGDGVDPVAALQAVERALPHLHAAVAGRYSRRPSEAAAEWDALVSLAGGPLDDDGRVRVREKAGSELVALDVEAPEFGARYTALVTDDDGQDVLGRLTDGVAGGDP
jgi:hypothetical protein